MKSIKTVLLIATIAAVSFSCSKPSVDTGPACETNHTTKVTFKNTNAFAIRIELADRFDASYMPVGLVFTMDLAAGASETKEFKAGRYYYQAKCSTCSSGTVFSRTYDECQEYQE